MNAKQKRFCDEYLACGNATQAAIRAGYSEKTAKQIGHQNLTKLDLQNYINAELEKLHNENTANAQEVMEYLTSVMRGEAKEEVLQNNGYGIQVVTKIQVSAKDRIKAAELIGKYYGMWNERVNMDGNCTMVIIDDIGGEKNGNLERH